MRPALTLTLTLVCVLGTVVAIVAALFGLRVPAVGYTGLDAWLAVALLFVAVASVVGGVIVGFISRMAK